MLIGSLVLGAQVELTLHQSMELVQKNKKTLQKAREEVSKYREEYNNVRGNLLPEVSLEAGCQFSKIWMPDAL